MKFTTLNIIRFTVPGAMLYALLSSVCSATGWCSLPLPEQWAEFGKLTLSVVFSFFYSALPFRFGANAIYFAEVNRNLVERLTSPFENDPLVPKPLQWRHVRPIFYKIVDSDKSLSHQSLRAFASGALWTSAADLRAVSLFGACLFFLVCLIGVAIPEWSFPVHCAVLGMAACLVLTLLSFPLSSLLTKNHMDIGNEQVDFILTHYRGRLRDDLAKITV